MVFITIGIHIQNVWSAPALVRFARQQALKMLSVSYIIITYCNVHVRYTSFRKLTKITKAVILILSQYGQNEQKKLLVSNFLKNSTIYEIRLAFASGEKESYKKEEILEMLDKIALAKEQE